SPVAPGTPPRAAGPSLPEPVPPPRTDAAPAEPVPEAQVFERGGVVGVPECEGDVQADELEFGDASLRLRLVSDPGDEPVEMDVRLWRLDVPDGLSWTSGDEVRAQFRSSKSGDTFKRLPPGRYRVQCFDSRHGAEDPEFQV